MNVEEMERRFFELKGKLDVGTIDEAEFKTQIEKLKFQDKDGHWWMIGAQSGKWYTFDGARWLPGKPPKPTPSPPAAEPEKVAPVGPGAPVTPPAAPDFRSTTPLPPPPVATSGQPPSQAAKRTAADLASKQDTSQPPAQETVPPWDYAQELPPPRPAVSSQLPAQEPPAPVQPPSQPALPPSLESQPASPQPAFQPAPPPSQESPVASPRPPTSAPAPVQPPSQPATQPSPLPPAPSWATPPPPSEGTTSALPPFLASTHEQTTQPLGSESRPAQAVQPAGSTPPPLPPFPPVADHSLPTYNRLPSDHDMPGGPEQLQMAPAAERVARRRAAASHGGFRLPISGPIIIIGAAVVAILAVLVMWLALDNLVPGKPISSFFGGLAGGKTAASLTPGSPTAEARGARDISEFISVGDQLMLNSNVDSAITQYQTASKVAPSSAVPLTHWSRALAYRGELQESLAKAQQAVQFAPDDADANAQLARALAWNGQIDAALSAGQKAVQLDAKNSNAHAYLAEAYLLAHRIPDAQSQAQTAIQLSPRNAEAYRSMAWFYTVQGQKGPAVEAWQQTLTLEPDFYFRHYEVAEVLRVYFNASADAIPEYEKSIGLYGAYVPALSRLGIAFLAADQPQQSTAQLEHAITLDAKNADSYAYLGIAFGQLKQCAQAIPYFEQALQVDANNSLAQIGLSDCKGGKTPDIPAASPPNVPLLPPALVTTQ
ncbi:MAG: hypothetical protein M1482_01285 [Chloroflexi bacterium]|nr:hypothetical protein [Chloroflexota bacterium]